MNNSKTRSRLTKDTKSSSDNKNKKMIKCVGSLIYDTEKDMFLLQQRSRTSSFPLKWGFWGGKLEGSESFANGLKREIKEELGVEPVFDKLYPLDVFLSRDKTFIYYSFVMVVTGFDDFRISKRETNDSVWLPLNCIPKIDLHPGLKTSINNKYHIMENIRKNHGNHKL